MITDTPRRIRAREFHIKPAPCGPKKSFWSVQKWRFSCNDNGGKHQVIKVKAPDKTGAISEGFKQAKKKSHGDIIAWDCRLIRAD